MYMIPRTDTTVLLTNIYGLTCRVPPDGRPFWGMQKEVAVGGRRAGFLQRDAGQGRDRKGGAGGQTEARSKPGGRGDPSTAKGRGSLWEAGRCHILLKRYSLKRPFAFNTMDLCLSPSTCLPCGTWRSGSCSWSGISWFLRTMEAVSISVKSSAQLWPSSVPTRKQHKELKQTWTAAEGQQPIVWLEFFKRNTQKVNWTCCIEYRKKPFSSLISILFTD